MRRALALRTGHNPFQLIVMSSGVLSAVAGLAFPASRSDALVNAFPRWFLVGWYASLLIWCTLVVAATIRPDRLPMRPDTLHTRLMLESAGLLGMGCSCAAYGVAAVTYAGAKGVTGLLFVGLYAGAALWRAGEIRTDLRKLRAALDHPRAAEPTPLADPKDQPKDES